MAEVILVINAGSSSIKSSLFADHVAELELLLRGLEVRTERVVVAHLGNGASMCAIKSGKSGRGFSTTARLEYGNGMRHGGVPLGLVGDLHGATGGSVAL